MSIHFTIEYSDTHTAARVGRITTPWGEFATPAFMPVGTRGSVKGLTPQMIRETGSEIILANTYHLMLRPGGMGAAANVCARRLPLYLAPATSWPLAKPGL
jgi:queuine tRNA-ribosyltransferase